MEMHRQQEVLRISKVISVYRLGAVLFLRKLSKNQKISKVFTRSNRSSMDRNISQIAQACKNSFMEKKNSEIINSNLKSLNLVVKRGRLDQSLGSVSRDSRDFSQKRSLVCRLGIDKEEYRILRDNLRLSQNSQNNSSLIQECRQNLGHPAKISDKVVMLHKLRGISQEKKIIGRKNKSISI